MVLRHFGDTKRSTVFVWWTVCEHVYFRGVIRRMVSKSRDLPNGRDVEYTRVAFRLQFSFITYLDPITYINLASLARVKAQLHRGYICCPLTFQRQKSKVHGNAGLKIDRLSISTKLYTAGYNKRNSLLKDNLSRVTLKLAVL